MTDAPTKYCTGCDQWKVLSEFYVSRRAKDGKQSRCKTCQRPPQPDVVPLTPRPPTPKRKPGRRTKEEELREAFVATGGDLEKLREFLGGALPVPAAVEMGEAPEKFADWMPQLRKLLWAKAQEFDGIAAVNAYKLIRDLALEEREEDARRPDDADERRPLLDRIEALPREHAAVLVKQELARTDQYRDDLFIELAKLEAE